MAGINPNLLVTTLNVNGLHTSKTEICRTEFKKWYNYIFSKRDILYIQKYKLIVRMEKYILCKQITKKNKSWSDYTYISKTDLLLKQKLLLESKKEKFNNKMINLPRKHNNYKHYMLTNKAPKFMKQ